LTTKLYSTLAAELGDMIRSGTLRSGDRMPSVRQLCQERRLSPATAMRAYQELEAKGLVEARHRSGYFASALWRQSLAPPQRSRPPKRSTRVEVNDLVFNILQAARDREVIPLGSAFPSPQLFPWNKLSRYLGSSARNMDPWSTVESLPPGSEDLRRQIARRYLQSGARVDLDEIVITSGALEALTLSLRTVTRPGDTVAIESPTFYACLQAIETNGLKAVEIPTDPHDGVDLSALAQAITKHTIKACWFMTTLQNPLGATLADEKKQELVRLLERHGVALIEDDVYGDLHAAVGRHKSAKTYDRKGVVLHCGSFSKCLAPGYRLGWVAAGKYSRGVQERKIATTLATSMPIQLCIAKMLREGGYDSHLAKLRTTLAKQQVAAMVSLRKHLPREYRVSQPQGGYFLWIELAPGVDALELHRLALERNISLAPGPMFSARREFKHFIRINCGHPWTERMDHAIAEIGSLIRTLL